MKVQGVIVVTQLRAILLLEADFNSYKRMLLAKCMIDRAEENEWIPEELYATRDHKAVEVALNQMLLANLSRLRGWTFAMPSVDASSPFNQLDCCPMVGHRFHGNQSYAGNHPIHAFLPPNRLWWLTDKFWAERHPSTENVSG